MSKTNIKYELCRANYNNVSFSNACKKKIIMNCVKPCKVGYQSIANYDVIGYNSFFLLPIRQHCLLNQDTTVYPSLLEQYTNPWKLIIMFVGVGPVSI